MLGCAKDCVPGPCGCLLMMVDMEYFPAVNGLRAGVGVCFHEGTHVLPPFPADRGFGNAVPSGFVFDFGVGEELTSVGV